MGTNILSWFTIDFCQILLEKIFALEVGLGLEGLQEIIRQKTAFFVLRVSISVKGSAE